MKRISSIIKISIIYSLIGLLTILLVLATIELIIFIFRNLFVSNHSLISFGQLMDFFGMFMLILIGIELLDTIKVYLKENVMHVEVVVLVGIIALAKKVVLLKIEDIDGIKVLGMGLLVIALATAYYLIKKAGLMVCHLDDNKRDS